MALDLQPELDLQLDLQPDEAPQGASEPSDIPLSQADRELRRDPYDRHIDRLPDVNDTVWNRVKKEAEGLADTAGRTIVGAGALTVALPAGAAHRIYETIAGRGNEGSLSEDVTNLANRITKGVFYNDKGAPDSADKYQSVVDEVINRFGMPMLGHHIPGRLPVPSARELSKFSEVERALQDKIAANKAVEAQKATQDLTKNYEANNKIPPETRAAQETLNAQDAGGAFKAPEVAPDFTKQLELPLTDNPIEKMVRDEAAQSMQRDLFARPEEPRIISNAAEAGRNAADELGARQVEQRVKEEQINSAWETRQQQLVLEPDPVAREVKTTESNNLRQQQLDDVQEQLIAEQYRNGGRRSSRFGGGQRGNAPWINDLANSLGDGDKIFEDILGKALFTKNMSGAEILAKSLEEGKDGKGINNLEAGANLTAAKRNSTLVREGGRWFQSAEKKAELSTRDFVFPAEQHLKKLSKREIRDLLSVMKEEMFNRSITPEQVLELGLTKDQLKAYNALRQMHNEAWRQMNEMRKAQGLPEITKQEAYLASRWKGDYRRPILDAHGKLVWYLAADSKIGLNRQWKALQKQFPDLVAGKDHTVSSMRHTNDAQAMLSNAIDILGRDDPAIVKIKEWAEQQTIKEGEGTAGQQKHFEPKANVRGFVGDRPGKNPTSEAIAGFQQQMTYAKNAFKWAEMQKVAEELKGVLNDPKLLEQQPNNVAYMKAYARSHFGTGEAVWVKALEDAIRGTGLSPALISAGVGGAKTIFIMQKMAVSLGFTASNIIQFVNNAPHMVEISKNPIKLAYAIATGIPMGLLMATGHYLNASTKSKALYKMLAGIPDGKSLIEAMKYAEDNGITTRSVLDESPIANNFSLLGKAENLAGKTLSIPETGLRSASFMTYFQLLRDSGKYAKTAEGRLQMLRDAEEYVNKAMGDYRPNERALVFNQLGTIGNALNTLQTYPFNFYQQWNHVIRKAAKGDVLPFMAMFAVQGYVAGAMAIPIFNDVSKAYDWMLDHVSTPVWNKLKDFSPKELVLRAGGERSLYGGLSVDTGIGMTSRVTAPGAGEMITAPGGPIADLYKQGKSVGALLTSPTDKSKQLQALMDVLPTGIQGLMETGPLRDSLSVPTGEGQNYRKTTDVADRKGMYARTPKEETIRSFGMRSQKEVVEKDLAYITSKKETNATKRGVDLVNDIYDAARNGDVETTKELVTLYTQITGKKLTNDQMKKQILDEFTTAAQRAAKGGKSIEGLKAVKQMQEYFKEMGYGP